MLDLVNMFSFSASLRMGQLTCQLAAGPPEVAATSMTELMLLLNYMLHMHIPRMMK